MNILIACEESQTICSAFRRKGHTAFSCDMQPCSGGHPEWHIRGDALKVINGNCVFTTEDGEEYAIDGRWDLIIAHPPCTYLSTVNNRHMSLRMNPPEKVEARRKLVNEAVDFFIRICNADCDRICVENPQGYINTIYRKPDQVIHPYMFAADTADTENYQMKRTCLWLKGLPPLERTNDLPQPEPMKAYRNKAGKMKRRYFEENHGKIDGVRHKNNDSAARSKTFPAVAEAMVEQWGKAGDEE